MNASLNAAPIRPRFRNHNEEITAMLGTATSEEEFTEWCGKLGQPEPSPVDDAEHSLDLLWRHIIRTAREGDAPCLDVLRDDYHQAVLKLSAALHADRAASAKWRLGR